MIEMKTTTHSKQENDINFLSVFLVSKINLPELFEIPHKYEVL